MEKSHTVLFFQKRNCLTPNCFPQLLILPCKSRVFIDAYLFQFFKESHVKTLCSGFQKSFVSPSGTAQWQLLNSNLYPSLTLLLCLLFAKKNGHGDRPQIWIEKSISAFPFLRLLELHVADEQHTNEEKSIISFGTQSKTPATLKRKCICAPPGILGWFWASVSLTSVYLLPAPKMGFYIEHIKAFNPEYFKGCSVTTNYWRRLSS